MTASPPWSAAVQAALETTAAYYDARKVGDVGALGFRRSTRLGAVLDVLEWLVREKVLVPGNTDFLDMGCADGRVNVFMSYLVDRSIGVEIDEWTLDDYAPLRAELEKTLKMERLPVPPDNCVLLHGDTLREDTQEAIRLRTGIDIGTFDLFFTYITLHQEFAELISRKGRKGAFFMIYGMDLILPRFDGLELIEAPRLRDQKLALYRKP